MIGNGTWHRDYSKWVIVGGFLILTLATKWILINYAMPFQAHVDELMILKNALKLPLYYSQGNFSQSTNLYNWLLLGFLALSFGVGILFGTWQNFGEFQEFLISDSAELLLLGRFSSLLISTLGGLVLLQLIFKMTNKLGLRVLFGLVLLFNPIEWNAVNWIKFDAYAYLAYASILYWAYDYFVGGKSESRRWMYVATILGVSLRIEIVAYLVGLTIYDFFFFRTWEKFRSAMPFYIRIFAWGALSYSVITLMPISLLVNLTSQGSQLSDQTLHPTFEQAIVSKIPSGSVLVGSILASDRYLYILFSLLGPVMLLVFVLNLRNKEARFLYLPFLLTVVVLLIFPIKQTHYLLSVSVMIIVGFLFYLKSASGKKWMLLVASTSLLWTISFSINFLHLIMLGDERIAAREYILANTGPNDTLLVDGIFPQIYDTPENYLIRAKAAKLIGSTGLSAEYLARVLKASDTRPVIQITDYEPFKGTPYKGKFTICYDTSEVRKRKPLYYVHSAVSYDQLEFGDRWEYSRYPAFLDYIKKHVTLEKTFVNEWNDPRLAFSNYYYFHPVRVYRFDWARQNR